MTGIQLRALPGAGASINIRIQSERKRAATMTVRATLIPMIALAGGLSILGSPAVLAEKDTKSPDWPCVQKKVAELTESQFWDGPPIAGLKGWWEDKALNALIDPMISRRVPIADIETMLKTYAASVPAADRDAKLTLLFAGLFDKFSMQRRAIMTGLEKYLNGQRDRSADIESQGTALGALEAKVAADPSDQAAATQLATAQDKFDWASRIFQERQNSIPIACEVPVIFEQRLYEVAKLIRAQMSK
jgi:hypothetical protein